MSNVVLPHDGQQAPRDRGDHGHAAAWHAREIPRHKARAGQRTANQQRKENGRREAFLLQSECDPSHGHGCCRTSE